MGLDLTSFDAALKEHYTDDRVQDMTYSAGAFFALVPKFTNFGGRSLPETIVYGNPQGRSRTFSNAQTRGAATSSKVEAFDLTRKKDYSIATIDNETLEASKGDANAFMEAATTEVDGAINSLSNNFAASCYGDTSGTIGQVYAEPSETASTFTVTLKKRSDVTKVEVGQMHVIHSAKTGGSQRNSDGSDDEWEVAAVNRRAGTITYTGTYDSSGTIAADDYIFIEGDRGNSISGLEDWIPASDPSSTAFYGVDRSVDVVRLGGHRLDASALPIEEALIEADAMVDESGWGLDHFFMGSVKFGDLKKALGSKVQYVDLQATAKISFRGIVVDGARGPIKVVSDHNCPSDRVFGLKLSMWKLRTLGKTVRVLDTDGLQMLRQASADGVEVRYGYYGNLGCRAPGANINIQV